MLLRRLIIKLKILLTITLVLGISAIVGGAIYLNEIGLNESARQRIISELDDYGIHVDFDSLRYKITQGLTATNVTIYRTSDRQTPLAKLPDLIINVDKTKMMRGKLKINTISLSDAYLNLPINPQDPQSPRIIVENASGNIELPDKDSFNTSKLSGTYQGINLTLSCNLWRDPLDPEQKDDPDAQKKRAEAYQNFLTHLKKWQWPADSPPTIKLFLEGNYTHPDTLTVNYKANASQITYKDYPMNELALQGDFKNSLITIDALKFTNQGNDFQTTADIDLVARNGRLKMDSSIHIKTFAKKCFELDILKDLHVRGTNRIQASGSFILPNDNSPLDLRLRGNVSCLDFNYLKTTVEQMDAEFTWNNGDLYLDNLEIDHQEGKINGRVLFKDDLIRYSATASLPARIYFPFIKNKILVSALEKIKFTPASKIYVTAEGSIVKSNMKEWNSTGDAKFTKVSYNGIPLNALSGDYTLSREEGDFNNIAGTFDYSDYSLRKKHGASASGHATVKNIHFEPGAKFVEINDLKATAYPSPIIRMFHKGAADHVEQYRFHTPPTIYGSGRFATTADSTLTNFTCQVQANSNTSYKFLGKDLTLSNLRTRVTIRPGLVEVNKLSARSFKGPISGYIHVAIPNSGNARYSGRFQWNQLHLREIGNTYKFNNADQGLLTGNFEFNGLADQINSLNGNGNIALSQGNIFSAPVFGPLSTIINGVLKPVSKKELLHEQAKNASCNFTTRKGVFLTNDLISSTPSMTFTGDGWINLNDESLDLTIRMNFRGLMGLAEVPMKIIELPLQALKTIFSGKQVKGLRQFRGTGKITDPKWQFAPFTPPRNGKNDPIFKKPPKAQIVQ